VLITRKHVSRDYYITHNCGERQHVPLQRLASLSYHLQSIQPPINQILSIHIKKEFDRKNNIEKSSIFAFESSELFADGKKCVVLATGGVNPYIEGDR
jgi:hypothetical protein